MGLYWHSAYDDTKVLTSARAVQAVLKYIPKVKASRRDEVHVGEQLLSPDEYRKVLSISTTPKIEFRGDDAVIVSIVTFSKWRGFERVTFEVKKSYPHRMKRINEETIVAYNWGVTY